MIPLLGKLAFFGMMVGWFAIQLPHQRRSRRTPVAVSKRDFAERIRMAMSGTGLGYLPLAYLALSVFGVGFGGVGERDTDAGLLGAGIVVASLALYMFRQSHAGLGRDWSRTLELRSDHRLRTEGVYAYVRHPMYAAFWLWAIAQALLLPNWIAGLSGLVGFGCLYLFRVPAEERMMRERFGADYDAYARTTPRVLPWRIVLPGGIRR